MIRHGKLGLFVISWTTCLVGGHNPLFEPCPGGIATLMTNYEITGKSSDVGFIWVRPNDTIWVVTCNPNCSYVAGYSATRNSTHSTLTIASVQSRDEGVWLLKDANDRSATGRPVCHLSAREVTTSTPNISITTATTSTKARTPACLIMNMVFVWLVIPFNIIVVFIVAVYRIRNTRPQLYMKQTIRGNQSSL